jgi:hypothetical protein
MGGVWIAVGLTGALLVLGALSDRGFKRRAVE